jgi:LCP family protein required for cell wall assembly
LAAALALFGVMIPLAFACWIYIQRAQIVALALDRTFLLGIMVFGVMAVLARVVAIGDVAMAHRDSPGIAFRTVAALLATAALSIPVVSLVSDAASARDAVSDVFGSASGEPLYVPETGSLTLDGAVVDADAVTNILIMGGDAGPGRWGMRTDTMMLISVHEESGRTALTSIPRNLTSLRFPPGSPLAAEFPSGFDDLANALFTHVNTSEVLLEHYGRGGQQPEAMALVEAVGYSLNVQIDDFALVNMQGFTDVIDAVGGVTLELGQSVPLPPSLPGERALPAEIGPGFVEMDGAMAIAYARSRSADSDYQRMGRQRQLLAALGSQISPTAAARAFGSVTGALGDSMRTSLSAGEFDALLDRLGDNSAITESVGLAPPLVTPGSPDYAEIATIVAGVQRALVDGVPSPYAGS